MRVGKVIDHYKVAKHFITTITDTTFTFRRDEDKIATEAALDGLYIVRSNVEPQHMDATQPCAPTRTSRRSSGRFGASSPWT